MDVSTAPRFDKYANKETGCYNRTDNQNIRQYLLHVRFGDDDSGQRFYDAADPLKDPAENNQQQRAWEDTTKPPKQRGFNESPQFLIMSVHRGHASFFTKQRLKNSIWFTMNGLTSLSVWIFIKNITGGIVAELKIDFLFSWVFHKVLILIQNAVAITICSGIATTGTGCR